MRVYVIYIIPLWPCVTINFLHLIIKKNQPDLLHLFKKKKLTFFFKSQVDNIGTNMAMGPEAIDIGRYIPFKSLASIESFCSDDDGMLSRRKHTLLRRIQAGVNTTDVSKFIGSLSRIVFDPDFVIHHKWPVKK